MTRNVFQLTFWLILLLTLSACAHRLNGPIHTADGPPWIAEGLAGDAVPEIEVRHRIVMIGDAGYFREDDPTLAAINDWATSVASSSVLFLGDNIYNEGLTDDDREHGERILAQQLSSTDRPKIFISGNHDWGFLPKDQNAKALRNQQDFIETWSGGRAEFVPKDGCMGPSSLTLFEAAPNQKAIVFIALDPTPWLNERLREACPTPETHAEFLARLEAQLEQHEDDLVVVASHYPMLTGGPHGGLSYGFLGDLIVTPIGWMVSGLANTYEPGYADWIAETQAVLRRHPPAVYAAGHDHSLQILEAGDVAGIYVVSGAGAEDRVSTVTHLPETYFAHAAAGFVVVDFGQLDGHDAIVLRVIEVGHANPVFEMEIPYR